MSLSTSTSGDPALITDVVTQLALTPGIRDRVAVVSIDRNRWLNPVRFALFGVAADTPLEVGSLSKVLMGHLLAEAINLGGVTPDRRIGDFLPVTGGLANVTLKQLATHQGGLTKDPTGSSNYNTAMNTFNTNGTNPNIFSINDLCVHASAHFTQANVGVLNYSNMGGALVGQALSVSADTGYRALIRQVIFDPLGMTNSACAVTSQDLEPSPLLGVKASGSYSDAWWGNGYCPAGSVRTSVNDMAAFLNALIDDTAPGMSATKVKRVFPGNSSLGWFWNVEPMPVDGSLQLWHTGQTGGWASHILVDRNLGRAIFMAGNTSVPFLSAPLVIMRAG